MSSEKGLYFNDSPNPSKLSDIDDLEMSPTSLGGVDSIHVNVEPEPKVHKFKLDLAKLDKPKSSIKIEAEPILSAIASGARVSGESTVRQSMEKKPDEDAKYFNLLIKEQTSEVKTLR